MKRQEAFDRAVSALIVQGRPAYDRAIDQCLYRGPDGTKCAVGHLIPDEKYDPVIEGSSASEAEVTRAASIAQRNAAFVDELQSVHDDPATAGLDGAKWLAAFKDEARAFAQRWNLSTKVLDDA